MAPIVDGLEAQFAGKVAVRRINASTDPVAENMKVEALPTYIFLDSLGHQLERQDGANPSALEAGFERAASSATQ